MEFRGPATHPNRPQETIVCPTWAASAHLRQVDSHLKGLPPSTGRPGGRPAQRAPPGGPPLQLSRRPVLGKVRGIALSAPSPGVAPDFSGRLLGEGNNLSARAPIRQIEDLRHSPGQARVIPAWKLTANILRVRAPRPSLHDRRLRERSGGRRPAGPNFSQGGLLGP